MKKSSGVKVSQKVNSRGKKRMVIRNSVLSIAAIIILFSTWEVIQVPPTEGDWQIQLAIPSRAEFNGNLVTIRNVRNFRYTPTENDMHPAYYDKTYNIDQLKRIWYITEPFNEERYAAHTFLSFEFENGDFVSITIEARKKKGQDYSLLQGLLRTYPLIYIAADERDVVLLRANVRKDNVYVYPVRTTQENARKMFVDMLDRMNDLIVHPVWYNALTTNCTTSIAYHVNRVSPNRIPFSWTFWFTAFADEFALDHGLIDTNLSIDAARKLYNIDARSQAAGDVPDYSNRIRQINSE